MCETLKSPEKSDIFGQFDRQFLQPKLNEVLNEASNGKNSYTAASLIEKCHANETIYHILQLDKIYNISKLTDWRTNYGIGEYIENLKNKIQLEQLSQITLLSPETSIDLENLAKSKISDMDFSQFTTLLENEITRIDLDNFIERLKILKDQVYRFDSTRFIAPKLENEALWLGTMNKLVKEMKSTVTHLKETVIELEENSKFNHTSMRHAINSLLSQANRATEMIQKDGPELISSLTDQYVTETVEIIDEYVDRVIDNIRFVVSFSKNIDLVLNFIFIGWLLRPSFYQL